MDLGLNDRTYLVTAASGGLGLASARALVAEGARVGLVARPSERLDEAAADLGDAAVAIPADLADPATADQAVSAMLATFGRLDGAVISVWGPARGTVLGTTDEVWQQSFDAVFLAALRVVRAVCAAQPAPALALVLSTSVKSPLTTMAPSNGLRPGLGMLVKQLADEIGPQGGRVVGLLPGSVATDRLLALNAASPDPEAAARAAAATIPLRRLGDPAEFGRVAAFMVSPAASYLTGSMIPVDGGSMRAL